MVNDNASKLGYGTMLLIRAQIVDVAGKSLSMACTIAIRYSAVRRQFSAKDSDEPASKSSSKPSPKTKVDLPQKDMEQKVLDYQAQQYRLLPYLATSYALLATGNYMRGLYENLQKGISQGKFGALPEAHATSSGLKAVTTMLTAHGIEECRK